MHVLPLVIQPIRKVATLPPILPRRVLRIAFDLQVSTADITQVRKTACRLMEHLGIHKDDQFEIALLIVELASNALRHTHSNYQIILEFLNDCAIVQVTDKGEGFSPDVLPEPGTYRSDDLDATGEQRVGGYGLLLVSTIAENLDIRRNMGHGMTVRAKKRLNYPI